MVENLLDFVEAEEPAGDEEMHYMPVQDRKEKLKKYKVNVFIDNNETNGAPVIIENNPTYYNMFGKVEKNVEHGMYMTDFTMISLKTGSPMSSSSIVSNNEPKSSRRALMSKVESSVIPAGPS